MSRTPVPNGQDRQRLLRRKKQKQHFYVVQDQDLVVLEVYKYVCTSNKSTCRQQNTMPLKDEQFPELHRKMPNVTSETVEKTIVFGGFAATAGCYCHLLPATCAPKAAEHKHQLQLAALLLLLVSRLTTKSTCRQQNTMPLKDEQVPEFHGKLLVSSRFTTKSTCRQQNTMPLKDEQFPEFHGKMPNVTSETVEKTLLLLLATCYLCTKSS